MVSDKEEVQLTCYLLKKLNPNTDNLLTIYLLRKWRRTPVLAKKKISRSEDQMTSSNVCPCLIGWQAKENLFVIFKTEKDTNATYLTHVCSFSSELGASPTHRQLGFANPLLRSKGRLIARIR